MTVREAAMSWNGTPFHTAAAIKGIGVDCARLVIEVLAEAGMMARFIPETYLPDWHLHRSEELYLRELTAHADPVAPPYREGDILTYRYGRCVSHAGVYIGGGQIVHALSGSGVCISDISSVCFSSRFAGAWRPRWQM